MLVEVAALSLAVPNAAGPAGERVQPSGLVPTLAEW